jgi:hypothetical protein
MYRSLKIQTFQLTSNDSTSIIEHATFLKLGLYCSNKCRETIAATVTPKVLQTRFMLDLHHIEIIHSCVVDWIKPIILKKNNPHLFSATECVLNNILKNAIIVSNMAGR